MDQFLLNWEIFWIFESDFTRRTWEAYHSTSDKKDHGYNPITRDLKPKHIVQNQGQGQDPMRGVSFSYIFQLLE